MRIQTDAFCSSLLSLCARLFCHMNCFREMFCVCGGALVWQTTRSNIVSSTIVSLRIPLEHRLISTVKDFVLGFFGIFAFLEKDIEFSMHFKSITWETALFACSHRQMFCLSFENTLQNTLCRNHRSFSTCIGLSSSYSYNHFYKNKTHLSTMPNIKFQCSMWVLLFDKHVASALMS